MDDGIGVLEALAERLVERDGGDVLAGHGVHQAQLVDVDRHLAGLVADAEVVEGVEGVGAELDAGADLAELGRALEHEAAVALPGQAQRGRQAADAAAGDEDGTVLVMGLSFRGST